MGEAQTCPFVSCSDQPLLGLLRGHRDTGCMPVMIDNSIPNDSANRVAIAASVTEGLQYYVCHSLAPAIAVSPMIKRIATACI